MTNRASIGQVLEQLEDEGFVLDDTIQDWEEEKFSNTSPWFIQGLMGIGGWISAIFLLGFSTFCIGTMFIAADEQTYGWFFLILGVIFTASTTVLRYQKSTSGIFMSQLLLALHVAGHLLLIGGSLLAFELWRYDSIFLFALVIIVVELIFLAIYPDPILRFISTLMIVFAFNMLVYDLGIIGSLSVLTAGLALLATIIWGDLLSPEQQIDYFYILQPVGYGLVLGMFGTIIHEVSIHYGSYGYYYNRDMLYQPIVTSIFLLILLLWTEIRLLGDYEVSTRSNYALAIMGISILVTIPTMTTPGIVAGILVIVLAFRRKNWILLGIAYLFFAGFIIEYYYSLQVTLLTKSIILMITGVLLILGRLFLRRMVTIPDASEGGAA